MRILVAGGFRDGASPLAYWYEPAIDGWTQAPWLKRRRDCAAAAVVLGHVYVTGGRDSEYEDENACERFDPASGAWTAAANLRKHRHNHGAAMLGDRMYVVGGVSGGALSSVESYEPWSNAWTAAPDLPIALGPCAAFTVGDQLWAAGHADDSYHSYRFDPAAARWEAGPVVCGGRRWVALAADDAAIYAFGGETPDGISRRAERCDLASGAVTRLPDLPTARRNAAAVTYDHHIAVIGGDEVQTSESAVAESFDLGKATWTALAPMPSGCSSPAATRVRA